MAKKTQDPEVKSTIKQNSKSSNSLTKEEIDILFNNSKLKKSDKSSETKGQIEEDHVSFFPEQEKEMIFGRRDIEKNGGKYYIIDTDEELEEIYDNYTCPEIHPGLNAICGEEYYQKGYNQLKERNYLKAIFYFDKTLEFNPYYLRALFQKGKCYLYQENYRKALNYFNQVLEKFKENGEFYVFRALVLIKLFKTKRSFEDMQEALELAGSDPDINYYEAYLNYLAENYKKAIKLFHRYLEIAPDDDYFKYKSYTYLANCYVNFDFPEIAVDYYLKAINEGYNKFKDYLYLFNLTISENIRVNEAYNLLLNDCLEKYADNTLLYYYKGSLEASMENYQDAIHSFNKYIDIEEADSDGYFKRGCVKTMLGKTLYDEALADFDKAISLKTPLDYNYLIRGVVYLKQGNYEKSYHDLDKFRELNPLELNVFQALGNWYFYQDKFIEAIEEYNRCIRKDKEHEEFTAYLMRGQCYEKSGKNLRAIADYKKYLYYFRREDADFNDKDVEPKVVKEWINRLVKNK